MAKPPKKTYQFTSYQAGFYMFLCHPLNGRWHRHSVYHRWDPIQFLEREKFHDLGHEKATWDYQNTIYDIWVDTKTLSIVFHELIFCSHYWANVIQTSFLGLCARGAPWWNRRCCEVAVDEADARRLKQLKQRWWPKCRGNGMILWIFRRHIQWPYKSWGPRPRESVQLVTITPISRTGLWYANNELFPLVGWFS